MKGSSLSVESAPDPISRVSPEPVRVMLLIDTLVAGGKERQLVELVKGLSLRDDVHAVLVILSEKIEYEEVRGLKVPLYTFRRKTERDLGVLWKMVRLAREFRPDVIHSWELMCSVYAVPLKIAVGAKLVNGTVRNAPARIRAFSRLSVRHHLTRPFSDVILGNSEKGLDAYGVPAGKRHCIYNGFDMQRLAGLPEAKEIRRELGIATTFVVGMVGNFSEKKDQPTLIRAARSVLERNNDVTFLFIGAGDLLEQCRDLAGGEERIRFLGRREDVEAIVNAFDIGVLSTFTEGISNSVMEYMALGKPVIASIGGGTGELVIDQKTGYLVPTGDANVLADRILYLLSHPGEARSMGMAGRKRIESEFSLETMTSRFVAMYRRCAAV